MGEKRVRRLSSATAIFSNMRSLRLCLPVSAYHADNAMILPHTGCSGSSRLIQQTPKISGFVLLSRRVKQSKTQEEQPKAHW